MKIIIIVLTFLISLYAGKSYCQNSELIKIESPDSLIKLMVQIKENRSQYEIIYNDQQLIKPSMFGLETNQGDLVNLNLKGISKTDKKEQWNPLFGKSSPIINSYRQVAIDVQAENGLTMTVVFRLFNDGLAIRYELPKQNGLDSLTILKDRTTFYFAQDFVLRAIDDNIEMSEFNPHPVSQTKFSKLPMLVQATNCWMALNEASVFDFSDLYLVNDSSKTEMHADIGLSPCSLPLKTPWRVIQIGKKAGDLIESNILVNLNEPCQIENTSWILPGKSLWDWRNLGDTINGFIYDNNEASYKRLVDFSSDNSLGYLMLDAYWYSSKGPQFPREGMNIPAIIEYAKKKNVKILLYIDRFNNLGKNDWNLEEVLKTFQHWGASGIKYGFLAREINDRKVFVDTTWAITRLCARYQMLVVFHDNPIHPGGEERTFPNKITVEYCHAQQDSRKSFSPEKAVTAPFINGLSGPLDMSNGYYDLIGLHNRVKVDKNGLNSTVVGETARCLVNYSPLLILPDNGDVYNSKADLFRFIREMPDTWDETQILDGTPGEYIIVARRKGMNWFIAGNTNEQERTVDVKLDFLDKGTYNLIKFLDAKNSHYQSNKEAYEILSGEAEKDQIFQIRMAAGGGFCMMIFPKL